MNCGNCGHRKTDQLRNFFCDITESRLNQRSPSRRPVWCPLKMQEFFYKHRGKRIMLTGKHPHAGKYGEMLEVVDNRIRVQLDDGNICVVSHLAHVKCE